VVWITGAEDDTLEAIRGTDLNDQSKIIIEITNAANVLQEETGVEKETDQREEVEIETKDRTTDHMSLEREFVSAVIAEDISDATVLKEINVEVDRDMAGIDWEETDTTTDAMKTRAADLHKGSTKEGSHNVPTVDAETTLIRQGEIHDRQGEIRVLPLHQEDIKGI